MKGGFLYIKSGNLLIENSFIDNSISDEAGILYILNNFFNNILIINCIFKNNYGYSSLINSENGFIEIRNSTFYKNINILFLMYDSTIMIKNSIIKKLECQIFISGCVISTILSYIIIENSKINEINHINFGFGIYLQFSEIYIYDCILNDLQNLKHQGSCLMSEISNIYITNAQFQNYDVNCLFLDKSLIHIIKTYFFNNNSITIDRKFFQFGTFYCLYCIDLNIIDSIFLNNQAYNGAGIVLICKQEFLDYFIINQTIFLENKAINMGGGLYLENLRLTIYNSTFFMNEARKGAGIYYDAKSKIKKLTIKIKL